MLQREPLLAMTIYCESDAATIDNPDAQTILTGTGLPDHTIMPFRPAPTIEVWSQDSEFAVLGLCQSPGIVEDSVMRPGPPGRGRLIARSRWASVRRRRSAVGGGCRSR
jgi:hypothetical protein